jgi:hypothetical protein
MYHDWSSYDQDFRQSRQEAHSSLLTLRCLPMMGLVGLRMQYGVEGGMPPRPCGSAESAGLTITSSVPGPFCNNVVVLWLLGAVCSVLIGVLGKNNLFLLWGSKFNIKKIHSKRTGGTCWGQVIFLTLALLRQLGKCLVGSGMLGVWNIEDRKSVGE